MTSRSRAAVAMILLGLVLTQSQLNLIQVHWVDEDLGLVTIVPDESLFDGTDGACLKAAELFHAITSQGYWLRVVPCDGCGQVPSLINPMGEKWTKVLIAP